MTLPILLPKLAQNLKNHEFSMLDKSADLADFHDPQIKKGIFRVFEPFSKILGVWIMIWPKNRIFSRQVVILGYCENFHLWVFRRNFYGCRNFCNENIFQKAYIVFLTPP